MKLDLGGRRFVAACVLMLVLVSLAVQCSASRVRYGSDSQRDETAIAFSHDLAIAKYIHILRFACHHVNVDRRERLLWRQVRATGRIPSAKLPRRTLAGSSGPVPRAKGLLACSGQRRRHAIMI